MRLRLLLPALALVAVTPATAMGAHADQSAYVNPDFGKPTENADVDQSSKCATPDATDKQDVGSATDGTNNVHIDGCIYGDDGGPLDTTVTWEVNGVGGVFACPDPDADGPKTATVSDTNGDGRNDRCTQTGFERDNFEYHLRIVSETAGLTTVRFCTDPEGVGCADAGQVSTVLVQWEGESASSASSAPSAQARTDLDTLPNTGGGAALAAIASMGLAGTLRRRFR